MFTVSKDQTLALTGLYQSLALVQNIAWEGITQHSCMNPTIESVLKLNPDQYIEVYGSIDNLQLGIQTLKTALQNKSEKHAVERTRYAINLMYLTSKLEENKQALSSLGSQIERISNQYDSVADSFEDITHDLGSLYREVISPLGPKIIIEGDPVFLKMDQNASKIRALLLAGIRSIILWKQANGKRWTLLLGRKSLLDNIIALEQRI
ncbi:MAG: high frequency lysogenization protein HflD [Gammaproteobacteria bacterium]